jgi:DNA-binding NtrC family response regulator
MAQYQPSQYAGDVGLPRPDGTAETPHRLLVIDDDASTCAIIGKLGERAGFAVMQAASVEDATWLLRAHRFEGITLDLTIGKNSGIELLRVLADMACTTPIIVISGSMPSMRDLAAAVGNMMNLNIQQPVPKPIDFAKLRTALVGIKEKSETRRNTAPAA